MLHTKKNFLFFIILIILLSHVTTYVQAVTTNTTHGYDAYPLYSTLDPQEFMSRKEREWLQGFLEVEEKERIRFSLTPFAQFADRGRNIRNDQVYLGDISGRWNMIALLFGKTPTGKTLPPSLQAAKDALFGHGVGVISNPEAYVDFQERFGFFAVPLKFRKYGVRCELDLHLIKDLGFCVKFGYAGICQRLEDPCQLYDICEGTGCISSGCSCLETSADACEKTLEDEILQNKTKQNNTKADCSGCPACTDETKCVHKNYTLPIDLTPCACMEKLPNCPPSSGGLTEITKQNTRFYLMDQLDTIARELCLDICDFNKCSIEDVHFSFYWRHIMEVNEDKDNWEHFLLMPFLETTFTAGVGDERNTSCMFSLPFGNNGHNAIGIRGGLVIDFTETVELGFEAGVTHFFKKSFNCYRVPNSIHQSGIYPFTTAVTVCPGLNCFGGFKLATYHFLGNLSTFFQYTIVCHRDDQISLCKPDPVFQPCLLERKSCWKTQMANIGFNYDISPNISLGFLWQAPLSRKRAYRSNTVMFGFNATY